IPFDYETFFQSPETMLVGTLDCHTGETMFFSKADHTKFELMEIIKASCSMPLLSPMIELTDGSVHLDGGTSQPIPIDRALQDGYKRNVVVLTRNMEYRKSAPNYMRLVRRIYKDYPNLIKIFETRHTIYNDTLEKLEQWEKQGKVFIFRPHQPLQVSRLEKNPKKLRALYEEGLQETQADFQKLLTWINEDT
ncbi:MAG: patatin-like phospholipase family protein, partial [Promethearchaeota archaeon]